MKTFAVYNLGCRVNAAETNQFAQTLIDQGYLKSDKNPDTIFINTCSVTAKANVESLGLIRQLKKKFPSAHIIVSGCADASKIENITLIKNQQKESKLNILNSLYDHKIGDKFSHTHRYLLKIQSGCTANCSYCTVPNNRSYLWSLPIKDAIDTVNQAVADGYQEIIITGVNLNQYTPGLSNLLEALLKNTSAPLFSFGSLPLLSIDQKFLQLLSTFNFRLSNFLHIPLQSGSDKILQLMHRPYNRKKIINTFINLKSYLINPSFGTDIIVGFPSETDKDFQNTYNLCQQIGFKKIHVFRFSPRQNTIAQKLSLKYPSLSKEEIAIRSQKIRNLTH
jgi:threonylcarbamoyladenosine tRNA methylthiotransferase MtaB